MATSEESVQSENWSGFIPVVLSLAPSSLSSPTMPPPIHAMVARQSYLHLSLKSAVERLHKFAPVSLSASMMQKEPNPGEETEESGTEIPSSEKKVEDYPICWFEDEEAQMALRWHFFAGVLCDMRAGSRDLPWKIRLHFTQYPSSQILPIESDVITSVERAYKNSLKQALFLQNGSAKVAMSLTKQSHEQIWDSILKSNNKLYQQVNDELQLVSNMLPVRVLLDAKPPMQQPLKAVEDQTLGDVLVHWMPSIFQTSSGSVEAISAETCWTIQGLQIPLTSKLQDLFKVLAHPDHFLYIVVSSK